MSEPATPPSTAVNTAVRHPVRRRLRGWLPSAFAGLAAVILGLGVSELLAALVAPAASPVLVVGSLMIDAAPGWAKETAIALFGTGDKAALLTGLAIVLAVVAAAAGVLERWKTPLGRVVIGAAGVFGVGAAITRNGSAAFDIVPAAAATVVSLITLGVLLRAMDEPLRPRPINPASLRSTGGRQPNALELARAEEARKREAARLTRRRFPRSDERRRGPRRANCRWGLRASGRRARRHRRPERAQAARPRRQGRGDPGRGRPRHRRHAGTRGLEHRLLPDRHRPADPPDRPDPVEAQDHRDGRQPDLDHLRRAARPPSRRELHDADVRVERGRRQPHRQRALARIPDPSPARARPAEGRRRHGVSRTARTASPRALR